MRMVRSSSRRAWARAGSGAWAAAGDPRASAIISTGNGERGTGNRAVSCAWCRTTGNGAVSCAWCRLDLVIAASAGVSDMSHLPRSPFPVPRSLFPVPCSLFPSPMVTSSGRVSNLRTDRLVVGVRFVGSGVGPREAAADRRIVRIGVDDAAVIDQEHTATGPDPGSPLAPASAVDPVHPVGARERQRFRLRQRSPIRATGRAVRTGEAGQRPGSDPIG